jgi:hypothetical protein
VLGDLAGHDRGEDLDTTVRAAAHDGGRGLVAAGLEAEDSKDGVCGQGRAPDNDAPR